MRCLWSDPAGLSLCSNGNGAKSVVCIPFVQVLIDWINDVLVEERIIVKQLEEDVYDGQVLQKLLGESGSPAALGLNVVVDDVPKGGSCVPRHTLFVSLDSH